MNKNLRNVFMLSCATLLLTGCIDNNYDLSDIDTTSEIKIKDLTIPVNLDPITLGDIIKIDEDGNDQIKKITLNGQTFYAVEESGKYHSDKVNISTFEVAPSPIESTVASFSTIPTSARRKAQSSTLKYKLDNPVVKQLSYNATGIDKAIHSVESIMTDNAVLELKLSLQNASSFSAITMTNVAIQIPAGLSIVKIAPASATYNYNDGILNIPSLTFDSNGKAAVSITTNGVSLKANKIDIDYPNHRLNFNSTFNVNSAEANLTTDLQNVPTTIKFNIDYSIDKLTATHVTGMLEYNLEGTGLAIDPIALNDIPKFLSDKRTNLILYNPQIYLNITNPVGDAKLNYRSGLQILAERPGLSDTEITLDSFEVGHAYGEGPYNFCLSPEIPENVPSEYSAGLKEVPFPTLSNLLSGEGLPKRLKLKLVKPEIYLQKAENFHLGVELPGLEGNYRFLAPLALRGDADSGSIIVYSETKKGWFDDDLSDLEINHLEITALVTSQIPFNATLTGNPVDGKGNIIYYTDASGNRVPVSIKGAEIPAGKTDYPVTITLDGVIKDLDGISFEAIVRSNGSNEALSPNQSLILKQPKVKISGKYVTDF